MPVPSVKQRTHQGSSPRSTRKNRNTPFRPLVFGLLILGALANSGCMYGPLDGSRVTSTVSKITCQGATVTPGETINIYVFNFDHDRWDLWGFAQTDDEGVGFLGARLYPWSKTIHINRRGNWGFRVLAETESGSGVYEEFESYTMIKATRGQHPHDESGLLTFSALDDPDEYDSLVEYYRANGTFKDHSIVLAKEDHLNK